MKIIYSLLYFTMLIMPSILNGGVSGRLIADSKHNNKCVVFIESGIVGPIYYSRQATQEVIQAAQELGYYLERVSGHDWPVMPESDIIGESGIFVGDTIQSFVSDSHYAINQSADGNVGANHLLALESFRLVSNNSQLFLTGGSSRATVYVIYYFLQHYVGLRWYIPGDVGEDVPRLKRLSLNLINKSISPSYINRELGGISGQNKAEGNQWYIRNKLSIRWPTNHALHELIPPDLFESHSDWFIWYKGKRVSTNGGRGVNPNIANPEVAQYIANQAEVYFYENPEQNIFSISITDNIVFDETIETLKWIKPDDYFRNRPNYSDLVFHFANSVASDIWPWNGRKDEVINFKNATKEQFDFEDINEAATHLTKTPTGLNTKVQGQRSATLGKSTPKNKTLKGFRNQSELNQPKQLSNESKLQDPRFYELSDSNFNHKLDSKYLSCIAYFWCEQVPSFPVHPHVIPYLTSDRAQWFDSDYKAEDKDLIQRWCNAGPEIVGTWDYYEGAPYFIPRYYPHLIGESIQFMYQAGVRAYYAEAFPLWGYDAPKFWLTSQLLWNSEQNVDELMNDFFTGYFKESAIPMRKFFDLCEQQWMNQPGKAHWIKYWKQPSQSELFPASVLNELDSYLTAAESNATEQKVNDRISLVRVDFDFTKAAAEFYFAWKNARFNRNNAEAMAKFKSAKNYLENIKESAALKSTHVKQSLFKLRLADNTNSLLTEKMLFARIDFEQTFIASDREGLDSHILKNEILDNGWLVKGFKNASFRLVRNENSTFSGNYGLNIYGPSHFAIYRVIPVEAGETVAFRLKLKGTIEPGSRVYTLLGYANGSGERVGANIEDELPTGDYRQWQTMSVLRQAPADAQWALVRLYFNSVGQNSFIDIDDLEIYKWKCNQ